MGNQPSVPILTHDHPSGSILTHDHPSGLTMTHDILTCIVEESACTGGPLNALACTCSRLAQYVSANKTRLMPIYLRVMFVITEELLQHATIVGCMLVARGQSLLKYTTDDPPTDI